MMGLIVFLGEGFLESQLILSLNKVVYQTSEKVCFGLNSNDEMFIMQLL